MRLRRCIWISNTTHPGIHILYVIIRTVRTEGDPTGRDSLPNNKRLLTLEKRLQDEISKRHAYYNAHNVQNLQAKYISCKRCGSKVNKDYIHNNSCPVCLNDMLSDTVQKRLDAFNARIDGLKASIVAEKERRAAKAPTRYLVVYCEYVGWVCRLITKQKSPLQSELFFLCIYRKFDKVRLWEYHQCMFTKPERKSPRF